MFANRASAPDIIALCVSDVDVIVLLCFEGNADVYILMGQGPAKGYESAVA